MNKEIYFEKEGRDKLIEGVNKLNRAVSSTMGPNGKNVIIPDRNSGKYKVTKDGVSVAREIFFKDPIENIGAQLAKQAAEKTVEDAGDGTTTATVLTTAFVNNLKDFNNVDINKAFDEIIPKVIEQLKLNSRELKHEDIKHVASISANNDLQIGELIQQAYNHTSLVKIEESKLLEDVLELVSGMKLEVTSFSKDFINILSEPNFLLIDGKLDKLDSIKNIIESSQDVDTPLVIMCEDVHDTVLRKLTAYVLSQNLYLTIIKTPGFGPHRKDLIKDISIFTGAHIINDFSKVYSLNVLGKLQSIKITPNNTLLVKHESIDTSKLILDFKEQLDNIELEQYQKDLLNKRLEYLEGKISIIKVGGKTEIEVKERYDRYDDAVKAVACALEEGIVEGGGMALYNASCNLLNSNFGKVVDSIFNSLYKPSEILLNSNDVLKFNIKDMFSLNIIDPLKVTRCALENAVSVAKTILSTEAIVLQENEWKMN